MTLSVFKKVSENKKAGRETFPFFLNWLVLDKNGEEVLKYNYLAAKFGTDRAVYGKSVKTLFGGFKYV